MDYVEIGPTVEEGEKHEHELAKVAARLVGKGNEWRVHPIQIGLAHAGGSTPDCGCWETHDG